MSLAMALWVLVAPLDAPSQWGWTILDGPWESAGLCETVRAARLDADRTVCAALERR
jgi:hypothetical protein